MSSQSEGSVTRYAADLRSPDPMVRDQAARRIWERFERRLLELVRRRLNPRIRTREDEHDILQSMFKSFFAIQRSGEHPLAGRDELWKLLVWMTMCKVANTAHKHQALLRDVRREHPLGILEADQNCASWMAELKDRKALRPEETVIFREEFQRLLNQLPDDLRQIFAWKLEGYTHAEIGRMINRTERTVELKMRVIRKTLEHDMAARSGKSEPPDASPAR